MHLLRIKLIACSQGNSWVWEGTHHGAKASSSGGDWTAIDTIRADTSISIQQTIQGHLDVVKPASCQFWVISRYILVAIFDLVRSEQSCLGQMHLGPIEQVFDES